MEGVLISAFGELRAQGYLGIERLALIFQFVREEAHRFPVLAPRSGWRDADLEDLCGEFLAYRI